MGNVVEKSIGWVPALWSNKGMVLYIIYWFIDINISFIYYILIYFHLIYQFILIQSGTVPLPLNESLTLISFHQYSIICNNNCNMITVLLYWFTDSFIFYPRPVWPSGIVVACICVSVCVSMCVCLSVCPSVCVCVNHELVCMITNDPCIQVTIIKFGPKVQKKLGSGSYCLGGSWYWSSKWNVT